MRILQNLVGVATYKPAVYREISESADLWKESVPLVALSAVLSGLADILQHGFSAQNVVRFIFPLLGWVLFCSMCAFFAKRFYKADIPLIKFLRVYSYTQLITSLGLIATTNLATRWLGFIIILLAIPSAVIGIREASQLSTGKATLIFVLSIVVVDILALITVGILSSFLH